MTPEQLLYLAERQRATVDGKATLLSDALIAGANAMQELSSIRDQAERMAGALEKLIDAVETEHNGTSDWCDACRALIAGREALSPSLSTIYRAREDVVTAAAALHNEMDEDAHKGVDWDAVGGMWRTLGVALASLRKAESTKPPSPTHRDEEG